MIITTLEQFLEQVPKDGWYLTTGSGTIRRRGAGYTPECPISSLGNQPCWEYHKVAEAFGMVAELYIPIGRAADNAPAPEFAHIRAALIEALKPVPFADFVTVQK